jgi:hypothetical protein
MLNCSKCHKTISRKADIVKCSVCNSSYHRTCQSYENDIVGSWSCLSCLMSNFPFVTLDDGDFTICMSGLTDEVYSIYNACKEIEKQSVFNLARSNQFSFDRDINPDEKHFKNTSVCQYFLDDEFNIKYDNWNDEHGLSVIHLNCRRLVTHYDDLFNMLSNLNVKFDVIALSETWLDPNKHDFINFSMNGYTLYTSSRSNKKGGGVALYISDKYEQRLLSDLTKVVVNCMESVFVEIVVDKKKVNIGCV